MLHLSGFIPRVIRQSNTSLSCASTNTRGRFIPAVFYHIYTGSVGSNPTRGINLCLPSFCLCCHVWVDALGRALSKQLYQNCILTKEGLRPHWTVPANRQTHSQNVCISHPDTWRALQRSERYELTATLTLRWLMSYIYGAPILDVSRSHTTTQHSR